MTTVIKVERKGVLFLVIDRERLVDDLSLQEVQHAVLEILAQNQPRIVLDLGRVGFVSSAALGMLVRFRKRRGEHGFPLKLCGVGTAVDEAFRITGLNTLFEIYETEADAIASFNPPSEGAKE
jgi:anti-sigma B factor antagonist